MRNRVWYDEAFCNAFSRAEFAAIDAKIRRLPVEVEQYRGGNRNPRAPLVLLNVHPPFSRSTRQWEFMLSEPSVNGVRHRLPFTTRWFGYQNSEFQSVEGDLPTKGVVSRYLGKEPYTVPVNTFGLKLRFGESMNPDPRSTNGPLRKSYVAVSDIPQGYMWEEIARDQITRAGNEDYTFVRLKAPTIPASVD